MTALNLPRGLIVDLVTPLKSNNQIDEKGLERLLQKVLPNVQAVLLASPIMGEGSALDKNQREELLALALPLIRGQVPVLVWISQDSELKTRETLQGLQTVREKAAYSGQIYWVDTPLYYHSNRGLPQLYQEWAEQFQGTFLLHNDPAFIKSLNRNLKRTNIRTSVLKELSLIEPIQGLIFLGPLPRFNHYQRAVRSRSHFRIYDGNENHFLMYPSLSGVVSGGANLVPKAWQKVTASSLDLDGMTAQYPDQLHQLWRTGAYLCNLQNVYAKQPIALVKKTLAEMGIIAEPHCAAAAPAAPDKILSLKKLMQQFGDFSV
jgi:dihydrodipicolinate synthase/N-acetylneuraminate lyase